MLIKKSPIVVVLGHIDHGKTTLLDYIRKSNTALKEAGGITQKIGAYEIEFNGEKMTFIDTPGHSAFDELRKRGVKAADIGILIVAADEGVKEQTKESLEYLKSEKIPYIVAINKIDKKEADPQRVVSQLVELGVVPEKWGGEVPLIEISAKTGQGVNDLLEMIILLRDIHDLKVETEKEGRGFILEAFKDPKRGILASVIVQEGKVKYGDFLITSKTFAKIRIFEDDLGNKIDLALPSKPCLVGNFEDLPNVGEFFIVGSEKDIKTIQEKLEAEEQSLTRKTIFVSKESAEYFLIIKADNVGSLEALDKIFEKIAKENNLNLKIIKRDIGPISFEDVELAKELNSILISFNLKNQKQILEEVKNLNLVLIDSNIIYKIEEEFLKYIEESKTQEFVKGELEVLATFSKTRTKKTIGGKVISGKIRINQRVEIFRNGEKIGQGKIISLEKNRIPAEEVKENELCGLIIETIKDIEVGDIIRVL